ncbi:MAG: adenylate kinase [Frankiales bacterium]|jgi:adenylate kinase|nr:adenylate kinase [Frankiales bacterium]
MRLLLIGAPGAGKGTQAQRIADHFGLVHISSGDLLRKHVAEDTATGRSVRAYMDRGDLVPDAVVLDMLRKPVIAAAAAGGYVLDGFPRTVEQAQQAYGVAKELGVAVQLAVFLEVPREELVSRIVARGLSSGRTDDTREVVENRLAVYEQQTSPILDYYRRRERLISVNGNRPVDEVTWSVVVQLQRARRALDKQ